MRFPPWKKAPWFQMTVCIDRPSGDTLGLMRLAENWLQGSFWWERFQKATCDQRTAMLVGAFIENEKLKSEIIG